MFVLKFYSLQNQYFLNCVVHNSKNFKKGSWKYVILNIRGITVQSILQCFKPS